MDKPDTTCNSFKNNSKRSCQNRRKWHNFSSIPRESEGFDGHHMACCRVLAVGNHLYIYQQTQPRWTTLQIFCRKCTKSENPRRTPHMFCLNIFWTDCSNLMCDMVFCMPYLFLATFHWCNPYLGCLCEGQGEVKLLNRPNLRRILKYYNRTILSNIAIYLKHWMYMWVQKQWYDLIAQRYIFISKGTGTKWVYETK